MEKVLKLNRNKVDKQFKKGFLRVIGAIENLVLLFFSGIFICAIVCVIPYLFGGGLIVRLLDAYLVSTTFLQYLLLDILEFSDVVTIYVSLIIIGVLAIVFIIMAIKNYMRYRPGNKFGILFKIFLFGVIGFMFVLSGIEAVNNMYPLQNYIMLCFLLGGLAIAMVILNFMGLIIDNNYYKSLYQNYGFNGK